ncbi:MAG: WS/DGAT/MGAT family O-acyltransferase [Candidatus Promineifilaceae bacterium]
MSPKSAKMSNVDTAWWHMESPTNLMMITTIMIYGGRPDYKRIAANIAARLLKYDRFKQRVVDPSAPWSATRWEADPHFDLEAHLHRIALPEPGDQQALEDLVSDLISTPLDYSKPLWQMHIIENYGDDFVIVTRFHHCIADGIALMRLLLSLTDQDPDAADPPAPEPRHYRKKGLLSSVTSPVSRLVSTTSKVTETAVNLGVSGAKATMSAARDPGQVVDAAKTAVDFAARLGLVTLRLPDPATIYKGNLTSQKRAAWSAPFPLGDVKAAAKAMNGTINDVMVTAVAGALRIYMEDQGIQTAGLNFRAYIPVNLRQYDEAIELGNAFGLVFLSMPVGVVDRRERFQIVQQRMSELKESPEAAVAISLLYAAGMLPKNIENLAFRLYHAKATAVLTNVPGPQEQLYFAGSPLKYMMGWVPQAGNLGLGISIVSYNGEIMVGINTDAGLVPHPQEIIGYFEEELAAIIEEAVAGLQKAL